MSVLRAVRAVGRSGLFGARPLRAAGQWVSLRARHGSSLYTLAAWAAARFPDAPALVEREGSTTFRELVARADLIADALGGRITPGGSVGLLGRNHVTFVAALLASQRLGLRAVLLNPFMSPRQTLQACDGQALELVVLDDEFMPDLLKLNPQLRCWTTSQVRALRRKGVPRQRAPRRRGRLVVLSSGSTGPPKAVSRHLRLWALLPTLAALVEQLRLRAHAPTLLTLPLFHGHGLSTLAMSFALGAPLHLFARATPHDYCRALSEDGIEVLVAVPTVLHRLLEAPALSRTGPLRTIICGSAPLGAALAARVLSRFGSVLYNLYGTSECGLVSLATPEHLLAAPDSVGYVLPGVNARVRRADGSRAAPGEIGEVVVHSGRFWGAPPLRTGDLGSLSAAGLLRLAGRQDDLLICGGENVSPEAVEARIAQLEYVRECAVIGVPSEEYGQSLAALIVPRTTQPPLTRERLELDFKRLLPRMLRPTQVTFMQELPRNALGKLLRRQLHLGEHARERRPTSPAEQD